MVGSFVAPCLKNAVGTLSASVVVETLKKCAASLSPDGKIPPQMEPMIKPLEVRDLEGRPCPI